MLYSAVEPLEPVLGRRVVAAIAAVGDDALKIGADLRLDVGHDGAERVVVRVARQRLHMGGELAAAGAMKRSGDGDFHAELTSAMRLADAFDLGRVQRIDLPAALVLALITHAPSKLQRMREHALQLRFSLDLAHDVARRPPR